MNTIQIRRREQAEKLLDTLSFSAPNKAMAMEYLLADAEDQRTLQAAQPQNFKDLPSCKWCDAWSYVKALQKAGESGRAERWIRLFWAVGKSTAIFLLQEDSSVNEELIKSCAQLLGKPAAAAMKAEAEVCWTPAARTLSWLYQLAAEEPQTLEAAQALGGTPWSNMHVLLAGILLASIPAPKAGFLQKLLGGKTPRAVRQEALLACEIQGSLKEVFPDLSESDLRKLSAYIQRGAPSAPVPVKASVQANPYLIGLMGTAAFLAQCQAPWARCVVRVYLSLDAPALLKALLVSVPPSLLMERLDTLLQDLPGGEVTLLLYLSRNPYLMQQNSQVRAIAARCRGGARRAMEMVDDDQYIHLCRLLPDEVPAKMDHVRTKVAAALEKRVANGKDALRAYLEDETALPDSAVRLAAVSTPAWSYPGPAVRMVAQYRQSNGWDGFACRCAVVLGLIFQGRFSSDIFSPGKEGEGLATALLEKGLPFEQTLQVMGALHDNCYSEEEKTRIRNAVFDAVQKPVHLESLCAAAEKGDVFSRYVSLSALDSLTAVPDCAERARKSLLACAGDSSKQIQELLCAIFKEHADWAPDYAALLHSRKAAARWMAVQAAAALGGELKEQLEQALPGEKSAKVADAIRAALGQSAPQAPRQDAPESPDELASHLLKGGKKRKVQWVLEAPLPALHRTDAAHTEVSADRCAALLVAYCDLGRIGRSETAAQLAAGVDEKDLTALAVEVYERWTAAGAPSKAKWVLAFAAAFGGPAMTQKLRRAIQDWPQHARGAIACDAVAALALSPDPAALQTVDALSRKCKFRQVKAAASAALENAAQELGISRDELADRLVPDLGFSADGCRVFDYGPRRFTVRLTPALEWEITDENGKRLKNLPSPGKKDDGEKAAAACEAFKDMKKQVRTAAAAQKLRLETALSALRCWDSPAWKALFVQNPLMQPFAIGLIWGVYEDTRLQATFRYLEDGSFTTADEEEYELPEHGRIGLVHPVELSPEELSAWKQQLADYEITQSFPQLDRPVFRLEENQAESRRLETFGGKLLNGLALAGKLQGFGWFRGSVQDAGGYYDFYREDPALGLGVELHFSGCFVGDADEIVTVYDAVFYRAGTVQRGSYCYDKPTEENIFALGQIPPRYYSEIVYQLDRATASSTESDPDWKEKQR